MTLRLPDRNAEQVRRSHHDAIRALQQMPVLGGVVISEVELPNAVEVALHHRLGRLPLMISVSPPRGPSSTGRIEEIRPSTQDRRATLTLKATGWGATITVDVWVF